MVARNIPIVFRPHTRYEITSSPYHSPYTFRLPPSHPTLPPSHPVPPSFLLYATTHPPYTSTLPPRTTSHIPLCYHPHTLPFSPYPPSPPPPPFLLPPSPPTLLYLHPLPPHSHLYATTSISYSSPLTPLTPRHTPLCFLLHTLHDHNYTPYYSIHILIPLTHTST